MKKLLVKFPPLLIFILVTVFSCTKMDLKKDKNFEMDNTLLPGWAKAQLTSADFIPQDGDSIERITTLGVKLTNPYLVPNMQQAYTNLGLSSSLATVTNKYVRFKPTTVDQLSTLDSTLDTQGLELFDTPVDYIVTYEGDYYQDPSIPGEQITWQYAVVPPTFVFPSGITYEILAQIHIPGDSYTAVETEAERLASLQDSLNGTYGPSMNGNIQPDVADECDPCFVWDPIARQCVPTGQCGGNPPPPAPDASIPAGYIKVHDTNLPNMPNGSDVAVRKARVVARRWFKVDRVYTDINGHFVFTKKFKHKVRINIKFKNDDAQIRNIRGIRFWQMFFAVKKTLGIFSGDKSSINYTFIKYADYGSKGNMFWTAATVHNGVQEYRADYAPVENIGLPPQGLKIFISKSALAGNGGSAPMFAKRSNFSLSTQFVLGRLSNIASIVNNIIAIVKGQIDIIIGYRYQSGGVRDINLLVSDEIKETVYHELTHAAHYAALGGGWYSTFVTAEEVEIVSNISSGYFPYGDGTNSSSAIVALGESWAYYMGHYLADKKYGTNSSCQNEQDGGMAWCTGTTGGTGHPHLDVEEKFDPNLTVDRFEWIPQGLFYDLKDPANEINPPNPVNDLVSGYTNQQMFNAFSGTIYTLQNYRVRLLQTTTNPTSGQVTGLFSQYHY